MGTRRDIDLDVVRGAAVLCVLVFHLGDLARPGVLGAALAPVARMGWAGVELFFVLSGFLIGRSIIAEVQATGRFALRRFLVRRALRLWPALYVYLLALVAAGGAASLAVVGPVVLHVQNYVAGTPQHLWSLAVEEQFYLLAGLALPLLLARRRAGTLAALAIAGAIAVPFALRLSLPATAAEVYATPYRLDALAYGVGLALLKAARPRLVARLAARRATLLFAAVGGFGLVAWLSGTAARLSLGVTMADWASVALVLCASGTRGPRRVGEAGRLLAWLGARSYSTYLWHIAAGQVAVALATTLGGFGGAAALPLALGLAIAAGHASFVAVERPALRWRDRPTRIRPDRAVPGGLAA